MISSIIEPSENIARFPRQEGYLEFAKLTGLATLFGRVPVRSSQKTEKVICCHGCQPSRTGVDLTCQRYLQQLISSYEVVPSSLQATGRARTHLTRNNRQCRAWGFRRVPTRTGKI
jgi:hypothetical protein